MEAGRIKSISLFLLIGFFTFAGINHFITPEFYYPLIPPYLVYVEAINMLSGALEILLGIGLLFKSTRKYSAYLMIVLLIAFIPSHIHFIQLGGCIPDGLCVPLWVAWMRLLLIHPLFMLWVWFHRIG
jgi:uncharacterized membrane protein